MNSQAQNISRHETSSRILHQIKPRLAHRILEDHTASKRVDPNSDASLVDLIDTIRSDTDPTARQTYFPWILRTYLSGGIGLLSDLSRAKAALEKYDQFKGKLPVEFRDINKIRNLSDLEDITHPLEGALSQKELRRQAAREISEETTFLYEGSDGIILSPETERAAIYWSQGTRWCTGATLSENQFKYYSEEGDLVIAIRGSRKYQVHFRSREYKNARDEVILGEDEFADMKWAIEKGKLQDPLRYYDIVSYIALGLPFTAREFIEAITEDPRLIADIQNPTLAMAKRAISRDIRMLQYVNNQTEDLCLYAIGKNPSAMSFIHNQNYALCAKAAEVDMTTINFIRDESIRQRVMSHLALPQNRPKTNMLPAALPKTQAA